MKHLPTSRPANRGFTLIELLVAITVLALMTLVLAQLLGSTSQVWLNGQARVSNFTKARAMLDLLARDLQSGVFRKDLAAFPGSSAAFYTERQGFSSAPDVRSISLVQYSLGTNTIFQRGDMPVNWSDPASVISFGNANALPNTNSITTRNTAPGVVGFKMIFLNADGTRSAVYQASANPRAIAVGLAVLDDGTLSRMSQVQINTLQAALAGAATGTTSVKADWDAYLLNGLAWSNYPKSLGHGLQIFERYVSLP